MDNRIRLFAGNCNRGVSLCRNKVIDNSGGKYIAFVDDVDSVEQIDFINCQKIIKKQSCCTNIIAFD